LRKNVKTLVFIIITGVLITAIGYSLQIQMTSSVQNKVIEAGLIESGDRPALYFILRNPGNSTAQYLYIVTYNDTSGTQTSSSNLSIPAGQTFSYSISLVRPTNGIMVLNINIFRYDPSPTLLHNQTWIIQSKV